MSKYTLVLWGSQEFESLEEARAEAERLRELSGVFEVSISVRLDDE